MQVTKPGGFAALESPDGRYVYFTKGGKYTPSLWRVPVEGGEEELVLAKGPSAAGVWGLAESGIYYFEKEGGTGGAIKLLDPATRRVRQVAELERGPHLRNWSLAVSPDGRWLLYDVIDPPETDLVLVENVHW